MSVLADWFRTKPIEPEIWGAGAENITYVFKMRKRKRNEEKQEIIEEEKKKSLINFFFSSKKKKITQKKILTSD